MKREVLSAACMIAILGGAGTLRFAKLGNRPLHCDEAVHAIKFGQLLEDDQYVYNPWEYHGPSLNFFTLPVAWVRSATELVEISEVDLRLVPAIFGIMLVGLVWLLRQQLGTAATLCAALLTAISPAMVFYSRYYIQEMLLVCFTLGAIISVWRFRRESLRAAGSDNLTAHMSSSGPLNEGTGSRRVCTKSNEEPRRATPVPGFQKATRQQLAWIVTLGLCVGMMHASKETCVIALVAMGVATAVAFGDLRQIATRRLLFLCLLSLVVAAGTSVLFFSSFFDNPRGVLDSVTTYFHYLGRASGEGTAGRHVYPAPYYFQILFWHQRGDGPLWTEITVGLLAIVGMVAAFGGKGLGPTQPRAARFLAVYTTVMVAVYSALPYKTPWCALGFLHGMILLAGIGVTVLLRVVPGTGLKTATSILLIVACGHLTWQAWRASFVDYEHPGNPYVYAHTTSDVLRLTECIEQIANVHPEGQGMYIQVICPEDDYWPLPWYFRRFTRVGWYGRPPSGPAAPVIISQPQMEPAILDYLYEKQPPGQRHLYVPFPVRQGKPDLMLRPHVPLRIDLRLDLWENMSTRSQIGAVRGV